VANKPIDEIISRARFHASDYILEIGPGKGALTLPLARSVSHVIAVEKDTHLVNFLKQKLLGAGITNVTVVNEDILKWDFNKIKALSIKKIQVIGNLPYNISSPFLEKLIENRKLVGRAVLMFQLEVAKRIAASPGTKAYGAMTLLVQYYAQATVLLKVSRDAFYPRPKVDSMVLELDFDRPHPGRAVHGEDFRKVVKSAFSHRRKTLLNSLRASSIAWDRETLLKGMKKCGIDHGRRPETLDIDEFLCFTRALALTNGSADAISTHS
jgi:16S rRNA (adenine1518-N6/adenine1519-N6)-dimethyltransferase